MKRHLNKILLEAINRGIKFALDDFDDNDLIGQQTQTIKDTHHTKEYLDLMNMVVDLGLPSGTLWCKYNIGAKKENEHGRYYAWGELNPKHRTKYNWVDYRFTIQDGTRYKLMKYCEDGYLSISDKLTQLQLLDDVAYQTIHCHNFKFHIPTKEQFEELRQYTTVKYIKNKGWIFTSTINKNEIFIPVCGCIDDSGKIDKKDVLCFLWSSNIDEDDYSNAYFLSLYENYISIRVARRSVGMQIRPVLNL